MPSASYPQAGAGDAYPLPPGGRIGATINAAIVAPLGGGRRATAIYLIVALLPFQFLGIGVATTKVDLSNIVFLPFAASLVIGGLNRPVSMAFQLFSAAFAMVQLALFATGATPFARFVSGCSWIFSMLIVYGWRRYVVIDPRPCYRAVLAGTALLAVVIVFQFVFLGNERPPGTMAEPSTAGLLLLATAAGLLIATQWSTRRTERTVFLIAAVALVALSYAIRTTHLVSFALALLIAAAFSRTLTVRALVVNSAILAGIYAVASADTHYVSRVDVGDAASNLSLLAWLQGYDQMIASLRLFPLTGAGLGSTGSFAFISDYSDFLFYSDIADLNRLDAYSGFFRLMIETGPVFMAALTFAIVGRLAELRRNVGHGLLPKGDAAKYQMFLYTFALALIIGIMLKEPTFSRSQAVVAALLFFALPLRAMPRRDDRPAAAALAA